MIDDENPDNLELTPRREDPGGSASAEGSSKASLSEGSDPAVGLKAARKGDFARWLQRVRGDGWGDVLFVPVVLLALIVYLSFASEYFLTGINITNLTLQAATLAIVAFGLSFVIFSGELDLSVGASVALVSVVSAMVMSKTGSIVLGVLTCLGVGATIGLLNGLIVTKLRVPSFIATFGMLTICSGIALAISDGAVISGVPVSLGNLANEGFLGIRWALWLVIGVFGALLFLQTQTSFGIRVFAVGGNREASRLSAIPVDRVLMLCFVITGLAVGLGGLVLTARVQSGQPQAGGTLALIAIAAIVVGGNNLLGGRGSITRTLWGVLLLSVLENGLQLEGVNTDLQRVIIGAVFIIAASAEFFRRRLRSRARSTKAAQSFQVVNAVEIVGEPPPKDSKKTSGAGDVSKRD
jgi:ribose/xylose/arabinose/galactoside ABC-type transport system permease subunit